MKNVYAYPFMQRVSNAVKEVASVFGHTLVDVKPVHKLTNSNVPVKSVVMIVTRAVAPFLFSVTNKSSDEELRIEVVQNGIIFEVTGVIVNDVVQKNTLQLILAR